MEVLLFLEVFCFFISGCIVILCSVPFTRGQRERLPILKKLDGKQVLLVSAAVLTALAGWAAHGIRNFPGEVPTEIVEQRNGNVIVKATIGGFENELREAASDRASEAKDYFIAGERDFTASRFRDATVNYEKSANLLPTMSGLLNLGNALTETVTLYKGQGGLP